MSALGDNGNYDVIPIAVIETEQLHSLTEDDFSFVDEILECDDELNFYMELHCDARSSFGSLGGIAPEDYLNVYANYNVSERQVDDTIDIMICRSVGANEAAVYKLSETEREIVLEKMDEYCQEREGMTLDEYCEKIQMEVQAECLTPEL